MSMFILHSCLVRISEYESDSLKYKGLIHRFFIFPTINEVQNNTISVAIFIITKVNSCLNVEI